MFTKLFLSLGLPWSPARKKLVINYSDCPYVTFETVLIVIEGLRRHIDGGAHVVGAILLRIRGLHGEPEVSHLDLAIFEQDIGWFEVAVDDSIGADLGVARDDLA